MSCSTKSLCQINKTSQVLTHLTPIIPYEQRAAIVEAIKYVDEVVPQTSMDKLEFLKQRHFDVMFHGDEWKGTELYNKYEEEFAKYDACIDISLILMALVHPC